MQIDYPPGFNVDHYLASEQVPGITTGGVNWLPTYAETDEGMSAGDIQLLQDSFLVYNPDKPTLAETAELNRQRRIDDQADWLTTVLANKTPAQARVIVADVLENATTIAQVKAVLDQLLPILAAGLVAVAHQVIESDS